MGYTLEQISQNFNPRSREGSDFDRLADGLPSDISIHAPAKGATLTLGGRGDGEADFNPRSREGSDYSQDPARSEYTISIHAPAKGATQ